MKPILTESDKRQYIGDFWATTEPLVEKIILSKRSSKTKIAFKKVPSKDLIGTKRIIQLTNGSKILEASVDVVPWLWSDGSLQLTFILENAKNLVIPSGKLKERSGKVEVWRPDTSANYWIIDAFAPISFWLKAIELTAVDVGIMDNMQSLIQNLLK